jgi:methionyl-tRNA formyltransferase
MGRGRIILTKQVMRIVFFGTPDYALCILKCLHGTLATKNEKSPVVAIVTQKPKPAGRKKRLTYSPVDKWARKKSIQVHYNLTNLPKADLGVLVAYGKILPRKILDHFPFGIINVHPSLLPKFRGASPVQASLVTGEKQTGATIIKLDNKLDHGPILFQFTEKILANDTTETLRKRLFLKSATKLATLIPGFLQNKIKPHPQDHKKATFTKTIKKSDAFIPPHFLKVALEGKKIKDEWKISFIKNSSFVPDAQCLERFIRAMQPWPVAWTHIQLKQKTKNQKLRRLKILKAHLEKKPLITSHKLLVLDKVQLEGKKPVSWKQFKEGYPKAKLTQ